jgi:hypothetical protein
MTGDRGSCHAPRWMQDSCIKVLHFGLQRKELNWVNLHNKDYGCVQVGGAAGRDVGRPVVVRVTGTREGGAARGGRMVPDPADPTVSSGNWTAGPTAAILSSAPSSFGPFPASTAGPHSTPCRALQGVLERPLLGGCVRGA